MQMRLARPRLIYRCSPEIRSPPRGECVLAFRREDVTHSCQGFVASSQKVEGFKKPRTDIFFFTLPNRPPPADIYTHPPRLISVATFSGARFLSSEKWSKVTAMIESFIGCDGKPTFQHTVPIRKPSPAIQRWFAAFVKR